MKIWKVVLATLVIFVAGVLTGALLAGYSDQLIPAPHRTPAEVTLRSTRPAPIREPGVQPLAMPQLPLLRKDFLDRLGRELQLTPAQREHIEKVMCDGQEQTRELWLRIEPDVREELRAVKQKIRSELTAEQLARFEELMKRPLRKPGQPSNQPTAPPPPSEPPRSSLPADRALGQCPPTAAATLTEKLVFTLLAPPPG